MKVLVSTRNVWTPGGPHEPSTHKTGVTSLRVETCPASGRRGGGFIRTFIQNECSDVPGSGSRETTTGSGSSVVKGSVRESRLDDPEGSYGPSDTDGTTPLPREDPEYSSNQSPTKNLCEEKLLTMSHEPTFLGGFSETHVTGD